MRYFVINNSNTWGYFQKPIHPKNRIQHTSVLSESSSLMESGVSLLGLFSLSISIAPSELVSEFLRFVPLRVSSWSVLLYFLKGTPPPPIWSERLVLRICFELCCWTVSEKWGRKDFRTHEVAEWTIILPMKRLFEKCVRGAVGGFFTDVRQS